MMQVMIDESITAFLAGLSKAEMQVLLNFYAHLSENGILSTADLVRYNQILKYYNKKFTL